MDIEEKEKINEEFGKFGNPLDDAASDVMVAEAKRNTLDRIVVDIDRPIDWCSFPIVSRNDELRLAAMRSYIGNDVKRLKQEQGFLVSNLYLTSQHYTAKDGEIIEGPVLHLISPEGKSCRITAKYTILAILTFAKSWHKFPWEPPVRIRVKDTVLDSGNRVYEVEYLE